jgi:hypothetical protein
MMMMEAAHISQTSVYFNEITQRYVLEGCHLHIRRRENLKTHKVKLFLETLSSYIS